MEYTEFVPVTIFCSHHSIEVSFITALQDYNLIEIINKDKEDYIPVHQLTEAERLVRLHNELNINTEGLDAVFHLLQKMKDMQHEMEILKNRLRFYEP